MVFWFFSSEWRLKEGASWKNSVLSVRLTEQAADLRLKAVAHSPQSPAAPLSRPVPWNQLCSFLYSWFLSWNIILSHHTFLALSVAFCYGVWSASTPNLGLAHLRAKRLRTIFSRCTPGCAHASGLLLTPPHVIRCEPALCGTAAAAWLLLPRLTSAMPTCSTHWQWRWPPHATHHHGHVASPTAGTRIPCRCVAPVLFLLTACVAHHPVSCSSPLVQLCPSSSRRPAEPVSRPIDAASEPWPGPDARKSRRTDP